MLQGKIQVGYSSTAENAAARKAFLVSLWCLLEVYFGCIRLSCWEKKWREILLRNNKNTKNNNLDITSVKFYDVNGKKKNVTQKR